jgi:hypothetical protein
MPTRTKYVVIEIKGSKAHAPHAADHRTPQPEFPRRDGFLDHRRRAGTRGDADAHEPKGAPWPELEHSVSRSGICREHASPADPNRFAANRLASSTSSAYRDAVGGVESRCGAVVLGLAYRFPALSVAGASLASPWLRFHIPLIKPGVRFSRTRLSDKAIRHMLLHTFAHEQSPLGSLEPV